MHASDSLVISTYDLSKSYQGVNALQPLDLHVNRHSIFGFLGPNGAGRAPPSNSCSAWPSRGEPAVGQPIPRTLDRSLKGISHAHVSR